MNRPDLDAYERFWAKVDKTELTGCWMWTAARIRNYGCFKGLGRSTLAHRISYELANGGIPKGFQIDHLCRITLCVNPQHLEAVTPKENKRRSLSPAAINGRKVKCNSGHRFTQTNTYVTKDGTRKCRECNRQNVKNIYWRNKAS